MGKGEGCLSTESARDDVLLGTGCAFLDDSDDSPLKYDHMEHRMTVRSNPRIVMLFAIIAAMGAATVLGFIFLSTLYGVIFLAVAIFLSYRFLRFARSHMRSSLWTDDEGITFHMPTGDDEHFDWDELSHAGYCSQAKGRPFAFVYSSDRDRLITVPREYEHFEELLAELSERVEYTTFDLGPGVTIHEKLRELLGLPDPTEAADDEEPSDDEETEDDEEPGDDEESSSPSDE